MRASPIYNIIHNPSRASDCSFGASDRFDQDIRVGTSSKNSHTLANISVERYQLDDGRVQFTLFIDGLAYRRGYLKGKDFEHGSAWPNFGG